MLMVASGREIRLDVLVCRQKPELVLSRLRKVPFDTPEYWHEVNVVFNYRCFLCNIVVASRPYWPSYIAS
jgi:hypothetical protein